MSSIYPFYRVFDEKGEQYCDCGWEQHAQELLLMNRGKRLTYRRIDALKPLNPETVDVGVIPTEELSGQQGLPRAVERLHDDLRTEHELGLPQSDSMEF
ncbi:hypothetical protein PRTG_00071 [Prochlorococcus phage P-SSM5]|uniref:Uncharacterized protein n=1 Tax=Prochlorococcus phage P-SSM5 TaxID=536454 RepID=R9S854_9CAUD|nr:hypothetical protein PRTG_00071 [Prochlorococcus phage P-SSM5]